MQVQEKPVIVHDYTEALIMLLKDDYEERIEILLTKAKEEAERKITVSEKQAEEKAKEQFNKGLAILQERYKEAYLAAKYHASQKQALAQEQLLIEALQLIEKKISSLTEKENLVLVKKMYVELLENITSEGYNIKEFTFSIWKKAKIAGVKSTLSEIKVYATNGPVIFEDSITERLREEQSNIKQQILKQMV